MVNAAKIRPVYPLLLALLVLSAAAWLRGAEYDEQYTLFLTAGTPRPLWPEAVFPASLVAAVQTGHANLIGIAGDLRATDVHPPLYFWAVSIWRWIAGPSLLAARMFSVLCGMVSITLVGKIARRCSISPAAAMLLTLGCYGFVYTNAIARGFAPAQMLALCAVMLVSRGRHGLAGVCFGAACCCNYLAVFIAIAAILAAGAWSAVPAMLPFLTLDAWFFLAQRAARPGQFPPFEVWPSLKRLAEYQIAAVFGGLPMYVDGAWRILAGAAVGLMGLAVVVWVVCAQPWKTNPAIRTLVAAAIAPPLGLLVLGAAFNNTPIELRYLSFGLPFLALLVASTIPQHESRQSQPACFRRGCPALSWGWECHGWSRSMRYWSGSDHGLRAAWPSRVRPGPGRSGGRRSLLLPMTLLLLFQLAGVTGLLLAPQTMQPARTAAAEARRQVGDGIVLLPAGNDGVGIVGAFGIEASPSLPLLLIRPDNHVADRVAAYRRVVLALLAQDRDSIAAIAELRVALAAPNWRRVAIGSNIEVYERTAKEE